jgi:hypothetical protein
MRCVDPQLGHASEDGETATGAAPNVGETVGFELERGREATEAREEGVMFLYGSVPEASIYTFIPAVSRL